MRSLPSTFAGIAILISFAPTVAFAGKKAAPSASPAAVLFADGRRLMAAGSYDAACPKLAESESMNAAPITALTLAICYEKSGKLAKAWAAYKVASEVATAAHSAKPAAVAKRMIAQLESKVSRLTIRLHDARPAGLEIRRDGEPVGDDDIGVAVPVDGGSHTVEVSASGKKPWKSQIDVAESGQSAVVDVPSLESDAPSPAAHAEPSPSPETTSASDASSGSTQRVFAIVAASVGVVGLALGAVAGVEANSNYHDALSACGNGTACAPGSSGLGYRSNAGTWADVSTIAFIGGGAALAGGAVLWLTASNGHPAATTMGLAPAAGGTGLSLTGRF